MSKRIFVLPNERGTVCFEESVLEHMYNHVQNRCWSKEAGGQIFSPNPHEEYVKINVATGPYRQDKKSRYSFIPNKQKAEQDRKMQFELDNHAIGIWHTHAEARPTPSKKDITTTVSYLNASAGLINVFLLAILGNKGNPKNLAIWASLKNNEEICCMELSEV